MAYVSVQTVAGCPEALAISTKNIKAGFLVVEVKRLAGLQCEPDLYRIL